MAKSSIRWVSLVLFFSILATLWSFPAQAAAPTLPSAYANVHVIYVGNTEAHLHIYFGDTDGEHYKAELYRDGVLYGTYYESDQLIKDTTLSYGQSYTYELHVYKWTLTGWTAFTSAAASLTAGQVFGYIREDMTWAGGTWQLYGDVYVRDGGRLTITDGAVVDGNGQRWLHNHKLGGGVIVRNATLRNNLTIRVNAYYPTIFSITDSVLEDNVSVEAYTYPYGHPGVLDTTQIQVTFANNRSDDTASLTVRDVDARNQIHVRVTGNDFPNGSFTYAPASDGHAGSLLLEGNTFGSVYLGHHTGMVLPGEITLRDNVIKIIRLNYFNGTLRMENNSFLDDFAIAEAYPTTALIASNTFSGVLRLHNTENFRIEGNQFQSEVGNTACISLDGGAAYNQVLNNRLDNCVIRIEDTMGVTGQNEGNVIAGNHITVRAYTSGISVYDSHTPQSIYSNTIHCVTGGGHGISIKGADQVQVRDNVVQGCDQCLRIDGTVAPARDNVFSGNRLLGCEYSIYSQRAMWDNTFTNNDSRPTPTMHHFSGYSNNYYEEYCPTPPCGDTWHQEKSPGENIVGGPYLGGNHWQGFTAPDVDGDLIYDLPYTVTIARQYPFTETVYYHFYDDLPLVGPRGVDVMLMPFELSALAVTEADGRYRLPVEITLFNQGDAEAGEFTVQAATHGWEATQVITGLAAGGLHTLRFEADITQPLLDGQGAGEVQIAVIADPEHALDEARRDNNHGQATTAVNARPRLESVRPTYALDRAYYLGGKSLENPIAVQVDWNGDLSGNGAAPYGEVVFTLNGAATRIAGQSWGAAHTVDMGALLADYSCANNTLLIAATRDVAGGEFRSLVYTVQPSVFPIPAWTTWLDGFHPGVWTLTPKPPQVDYGYAFAYPEPPFSALVKFPAWVPFVGDSEYGLRETQATINATQPSNPTPGAVEASGKTGFVVGSFVVIPAGGEIAGSVSGDGVLGFSCEQGLRLSSGNIHIDYAGEIVAEAGFLELVPAVNALSDIPVVERLLYWLRRFGKVRGVYKPEIGATLYYEEHDGELVWRTAQIPASVSNEVGVYNWTQYLPMKVTMDLYGKTREELLYQIPPDPQTGYLQHWIIDGLFTARIKVWGLESRTFSHAFSCPYPNLWDCRNTNTEVTRASAWAPSPRDYVGRDYGRFVADAPTLTAAANGATTLVANAYPQPDLALATRADGHRLLAYIHDDDAKPHGHGQELRLLSSDGATWSAPVTATDDLALDFAPAVLYDDAGQGLVLWERAAWPADLTPTLSITLAQSMEIAACTWDGVACSAPVTLTQNSLMDHAPRLARGSDGAVSALWYTHDGNDVLGSPTHPLTLTQAWWDGAQWLTPTAVLTGQHDVLAVSFDVYSATQAALVYARDMDGDVESAADTELFYSTYDGVHWATPLRLTHDAVTDTAPLLAYDPAGALHLLWQRETAAGPALLELTNSWAVTDATTLRSNVSPLAGFALTRLPAGLALTWRDLADGSLTGSVYDGAAGAWSADRVFGAAAGEDVLGEYSLAGNPTGALELAYQTVSTVYVTETAAISPTLTITLPNVPSPGPGALAFITHPLAPDLTFDSLTLDPANPAPGTVVTLTAVLRNAGALAAPSSTAHIRVDENLVLTRSLAALAGGYTQTVPLTLTVSASQSPHTLAVQADPGNLIAESDEDNNTLAVTTSLPDLTVDSLHLEHGGGDTLNLTARIANTGVTVAQNFTVDMRADHPLTGTLLHTWTVASLHTGLEITLSHAITAPVTTMWITVDATDAITEAVEGNNTLGATLDRLPDLTLSAEDIALDTALRVTLHNTGWTTATQISLAAWDGGLTGTQLYSGVIPLVPPGASSTVTAPLPGLSGPIDLWIKADPEDQIAEWNEGNNLALRRVFISHHVYLPLVLRQ